MVERLEGIRIIELGGAAAMPLAGMLLSTWGAEVIHIEPPGRGDLQRHLVALGMAGWGDPHPINYLWEHVDKNKKSIVINLDSSEGQALIHRLIGSADVFLNNLRPYEMEKFKLTYGIVSKLNPQIIYANLTGYGQRGPEQNTGGYDSVAFWARSGVMDLMHDVKSAPNISRPGYGDSITSLSLLAGIMTALFIRERTGVAQEVEVSLFNTATWVLGFDISGCLITGQDAKRPRRETMGNPIRNIYQTSDNRWIMLGMTNAHHYWPIFCKTIERSDLEHDPRFATNEARTNHAAELVEIIEGIFRTKTYAEWIQILTANRLVWSPVKTPQEVTEDEQAWANQFFVEWDHPKYGKIKVLNNPIKLSKTSAVIKRRAPELGEHTDELLKELGYSESDIAKMKKTGIVG
jgi:crotonobetainyl-CoA:carnitine CoA-transferase CaiB-like acyl-CoA transferase